MNYEEIGAEFDEKFPLPKILALSGGKGVERDLMHSFLREKLQQAEQMGAERAVEYIERHSEPVTSSATSVLWYVSADTLKAAKHPSSSKP